MSLPERSTDPVSLFYSYSHKDERLRDQLETHLSLLQTQGVIRGWHDRRIEAGTEWDGAISQNLEDAGIILLLVSADFLASRYCRDVEVVRAMERHEAGTARVIPVILRPVDNWQSTPFGKLQALPKGGKPVTRWKDRDEAFANVTRGIRDAARSLKGIGKVVETVATLPGDLGSVHIADALKLATSRAGDKPNVIERGPEPCSPGISRARSRIGPGYLATVSSFRVIY